MKLFELKQARSFEMWYYSVSRKQLLLRSNKSVDEGIESRLEVLFTGVISINMPTIVLLDCIYASEAKDAVIKGDLEFSKDLQIYQLGKVPVGYIASIYFQIDESNLEFYEPSRILTDVGVSKSIE